MSDKKGFVASKKLIAGVASYLKNTIEDKKIQSVPKEITKFIKEADELTQNEKHYSIERSIKLRGAFIAFLAVHSLEASKEMIEFQTGLKNIRFPGEAALYFSDIYDAIYQLLEKYPYREFDEAKLYFIDEETSENINKMMLILQKLISTPMEKKHLKFNKIVNFLNPSCVATKYSVEYKIKYQYISKEHSIEKYLPAHFEIVKNKIYKNYREMFATHNFDPINKKILENKRDLELKKMEQEYDFLKKAIEDDSENIDIKILSYKHASPYPEISFTVSCQDKRETKHLHLRSEVVNVLWYKPIQLKDSSTISDVLLNYTHAFGDVYYQHVKNIGE
ncbi:hypothetical protein [Sulfurimonas indica]|uniref:hypothetical protein n=1 Tax=Sulfurimonas TaxID=202746 RepID=UPI0012643A89|nr:hypothetical protein [Sulfurimonas indica]